MQINDKRMKCSNTPLLRQKGGVFCFDLPILGNLVTLINLIIKIMYKYLFLLLLLLFSCSKDDNSSANKEVKDYDGNVYHTVPIGTQTWLVENLKTTHYNNGNLIGTTAADIHNDSQPRYQWAYGNNEQNADIYGRLYTWYTATDPRGICPVGWRVATENDWETLQTFLGGPIVAGGKLKETGTIHWESPNPGATNSSGFTGLPGGCREVTNFTGLGQIGYYMTLTEYNAGSEKYYYIRVFSQDLNFFSADKSYGLSVRCIR